MASIQSSPFPLVFPVASSTTAFAAASSTADCSVFHTSARALEGMQKEAVVACGNTGIAWRMVCDEGPYLNGTDLAPFPLAFFCTGLVTNIMAELLRLLRLRNISFRKLTLLQDNRYTMSGSALAGTMAGGALPVELQLVVDSPAPASRLQQLLQEAVNAASAVALLRHVQRCEFSLQHNGRSLAPERVPGTAQTLPAKLPDFDALVPASGHPFPADIITKNLTAAVVQGVSGGAGSSLADSQKRLLHMRGICSLREDDLLETMVELYQPLGSRFRFLTDEHTPSGSMPKAPGSLAWLSAGLAFCYMTQIGRYTSIRKQTLDSYQLVQDTAFLRGTDTQSPAHQPAVVTHVMIEAPYSADYARQVVDMSEQTCFLHAACRQEVPVNLLEFCRSIPIVP